jgi:hypothetical protein
VQGERPVQHSGAPDALAPAVGCGPAGASAPLPGPLLLQIALCTSSSACRQPAMWRPQRAHSARMPSAAAPAQQRGERGAAAPRPCVWQRAGPRSWPRGSGTAGAEQARARGSGSRSRAHLPRWATAGGRSASGAAAPAAARRCRRPRCLPASRRSPPPACRMCSAAATAGACWAGRPAAAAAARRLQGWREGRGGCSGGWWRRARVWAVPLAGSVPGAVQGTRQRSQPASKGRREHARGVHWAVPPPPTAGPHLGAAAACGWP